MVGCERGEERSHMVSIVQLQRMHIFIFLTDATKLIGSIQSCGLKLGLEDSASGLVQPARIRRSWKNGFFINC